MLAMEINGKTALITGGAHRVGRAITLMLAAAGANVAVNYHRGAASAGKTVADARGYGVAAESYGCDITDAAAVDGMLTRVRETFGTVDILINNAGSFQATPLPTTDRAQWRQIVDTSILGTFHLCNSLIPTLTAERGVIINVLDGIVYRPWRNFSAHAVAKAGMLALTRQLAYELAPDVRVNAVVPGPILPPEALDPARVERIGRRTLLGHWGRPADATTAIRYLIEADYITGETLTVDGGERYGH